MRCYECGVEIAPGPVVCPDCGGDVELRLSDVAAWIGRRTSGPVQKSATRASSFAAIAAVGLVGARISSPETAEFVVTEPVDDVATAAAEAPIECSFRCEGLDASEDLKEVSWKFDAGEAPTATILNAYALEQAEQACAGYVAAGAIDAQMCAHGLF